MATGRRRSDVDDKWPDFADCVDDLNWLADNITCASSHGDDLLRGVTRTLKTAAAEICRLRKEGADHLRDATYWRERAEVDVLGARIAMAGRLQDAAEERAIDAERERDEWHDACDKARDERDKARDERDEWRAIAHALADRLAESFGTVEAAIAWARGVVDEIGGR
jgi:hypothetical protein